MLKNKQVGIKKPYRMIILDKQVTEEIRILCQKG